MEIKEFNIPVPWGEIAGNNYSLFGAKIRSDKQQSFITLEMK